MTALYRKWRSRSFDDLYGQDHVVRTLRNAVRDGRVAHAYLFTGPRGTGKTSTARILAKAVNCLDPHDGNPCGQCAACSSAQEGRALDVIEIDAASNTSVEHVRDLRERVAYATGESRYKVYIIDEVHRLSAQAFDAFLKTLEEPPPHVIFVFASTEPHKVPATIASRCQRFDFRRITPQTVEARLREIVAAEAIDIVGGALTLIAESAGGSLRDALGLLDQAASSADGRIEESAVRRALGLAEPDLIRSLAENLVEGRTGQGLERAAEFFAAGGDPGQLTGQLVDYWRAILYCVAGATAAESDGHLQELAAGCKPAAVISVLEALTTQDVGAKYNLAPTLAFELAYARAALALVPVPPMAVPSPSIREAPSQVREATAARVPDAPASLRATSAAGAAASTSMVEAAPSAHAAGASHGGDSGNPPVSAAENPEIDRIWAEIIARMRDHSRSLQAILRSGYLLKIEDGEATVAFLHRFHRDQLADPQKRRKLEEVLHQVLGSAYRVQCVHATREEIEQVRGEGVVQEDDGFVEEVAERLRQYHVRRMNNGKS